MSIHHPNNPFARYADDAVIHCKTEDEANKVLESLNKRMNECKLELHPTKTRIVYCKDADRKEEHENISFDFLGFTHYCGKSKQGKFRVKRKTSRKKVQGKLKETKEWLKSN